jgi:hypothetical protein
LDFGVTWRIVCSSQPGTSHSATGKPCEDSCWAQLHQTAGGDQLLSVFVADGAGSALHGGKGADEAIQAAVRYLDKYLAQVEFGLNDEWAVGCITAIREHLYQLAAAADLPPREFACTFLGVVVLPTAALAFQVGDGGIVLDGGSALELAIQPMSGEYANMTNFITDDEAVSIMKSRVYQSRVTRVAAFTDGLQRLALNLSNNTPHEPFFAPFFSVLATVGENKEDELTAALVAFLNSDAVNERTDDDKTLALALL